MTILTRKYSDKANLRQTDISSLNYFYRIANFAEDVSKPGRTATHGRFSVRLF